MKFENDYATRKEVTDWEIFEMEVGDSFHVYDIEQFDDKKLKKYYEGE